MPKPSTRPAPAATQGSGAPYQHRLERLRASMAGAEVSSLLVTNPKDVGYLTGFHGGDSYLFLTSAKGSRPVIVSDFRYQEELEPIRALADIVIRTGPMLDAVADVIGGGGGKAGTANGTVKGVGGEKVGIQAEHLTVALRRSLAERVGAKRLVDTAGLVGRLRVIKDEVEVKLIVKAARIQEAALEAVLPGIKPGLTELEVAALIEAEMKSRGSSEPGFQTIVAAGPHGALPHYRPGPTKLAANRPVLIDWGAVYRGYHSDMTRVFSLGRWPRKIAEIYAIVLDAQEMAAAALAPGKSTLDVDAIARDHVARHGYGEYFGHGLGHGLGLDGHEDPRLTHLLAPTLLEAGMVVTVEPGIYLPGVGGVRIEDDYLITPSGARNLCTLPKSMEWASR